MNAGIIGRITYKKKVLLLSVVVALLALANILTLVFESGRPGKDSFAWLDSSLHVMADRIELYGTEGGTVLLRKNNVWLFQGEGAEYPVKQGRVEDLLNALSRKETYPKRASSAEARDALAVTEGRASRVIVRGGAGLPLLDLLIGTSDALGREVYLRKAGQNEIHSGEDIFTVYTEAKARYWYDLRLFPANVRVDAVQQAEVTLPETEGNNHKGTFTLRRSGSGWIMPGNESVTVDNLKVEAWLRSVLEAEADDFGGHALERIDGSIILRLGDGSVRNIQLGPLEDNARYALVSDSPLIYVLGAWTVGRLFRELSQFLKD